jgi:hypothetical protein
LLENIKENQTSEIVLLQIKYDDKGLQVENNSILEEHKNDN